MPLCPLHVVRGASEEQFDALGGAGKAALLSAFIANNGGVEEGNKFDRYVTVSSKGQHQHRNLPCLLFDSNEKDVAKRDVTLGDLRFPRRKVISSLNHKMKGEFGWDEEQNK